MPRGQPRAGFRMTKNRKMGLSGPVSVNNEAVAPVESRFSINQRFSFVEDMVKMLAKGDQKSVVVTGPGGLGKSFTVIKALEESGLKDITLLEDFAVGTVLNMKRTYRLVKGFSTTKGLFRTLFENRDGVLVFDDTDSVLKNSDSLMLLKAALDSYGRRIISYNADIRDEDLPRTFEFNGRVVFISNLPSCAIDQAVITRSLAVDLSMTAAQKVERMHFLLNAGTFMPEFAMEHKKDAMALIDSVQDRVKELSLRTLIAVTKIRKSAPLNKWFDLAEYSICG